MALFRLCCSSIASSLNSIQRLKHFASDPMNQWPAACRVRFWSPANADMRRNALLSSRLVHILTHCCSFCRRSICSRVVSNHWRNAPYRARFISFNSRPSTLLVDDALHAAHSRHVRKALDSSPLFHFRATRASRSASLRCSAALCLQAEKARVSSRMRKYMAARCMLFRFSLHSACFSTQQSNAARTFALIQNLTKFLRFSLSCSALWTLACHPRSDFARHPFCQNWAHFWSIARSARMFATLSLQVRNAWPMARFTQKDMAASSRVRSPFMRLQFSFHVLKARPISRLMMFRRHLLASSRCCRASSNMDLHAFQEAT